MDKVLEILYGMITTVVTSIGIYVTIRLANRAERKSREDDIKAATRWQTRQEMRIEQLETELKGQTSIVHAERHTLADAKIREHESKIQELSSDLYNMIQRLEDKIDKYFGKFIRNDSNG